VTDPSSLRFDATAPKPKAKAGAQKPDGLFRENPSPFA
jgi:hypothetical protein